MKNVLILHTNQQRYDRLDLNRDSRPLFLTWPNENVTVTDTTQKQTIQAAIKEQEISFTTKKGHTYSIGK